MTKAKHQPPNGGVIIIISGTEDSEPVGTPQDGPGSSSDFQALVDNIVAQGLPSGSPINRAANQIAAYLATL